MTKSKKPTLNENKSAKKAKQSVKPAKKIAPKKFSEDEDDDMDLDMDDEMDADYDKGFNFDDDEEDEDKDELTSEEILEKARQESEKNNVQILGQKISKMKLPKKEVRQLTKMEKNN